MKKKITGTINKFSLGKSDDIKQIDIMDDMMRDSRRQEEMGGSNYCPVFP